MSYPVTTYFFLASAMCCSVAGMAQNCPQIESCPHTIVTICDASTNDSLFWNDPNFTWSPALNSADLPEASADLGISVLDTCPGVLTIRYTLFLDLDGDNLAESAVTSTNPLPAGRMLFGNAFTPGYGGPDTLVFDGRGLPDSMKFRFALEKVYTANGISAYLRWNTAASPDLFVAPRLPEGKHRIMWTVEKNGIVKQSCEYVFRAKDCSNPELACISGWSTTVPGKDTLVLSIDDFIQYAVDNITPPNLLEKSMRLAGTGTGFPLDGNGQAVTHLAFTCADLGFQNVEIWVRDLAGNIATCEAGVTLYDFQDNCAVVNSTVCATAFFQQNDTLQYVDYNLETMVEPGLPPLNLTATHLPNGCVQLPDFSQYQIEEVAVRPRKNDHPLNGVSTFDLVLIHRHIIGAQLFNQTWKFLAADANNSGSITTLDIIELRKLILGVYDSLPGSTSWKFVIADCSLDSLHPFQSACPGSLVFDPQYIPEDLRFWAIKTGDVNGTASTDSLLSAPEDRGRGTLLLPDWTLDAGATIDVPLCLSEAADWVAGQWALQWDPGLLDMEAVLPGEFPDPASAQPRPGLLTFNWLDSQARWQLPGARLCTLRLHARAPVRLREAIGLSAERFPAEAYGPDGARMALRLDFSTPPVAAEAGRIFAPQPNPTRGEAVFPLRLPQAGTAILELHDLAGRLVYGSETALEAGAGALEFPDQPLAAGLYTWTIRVGALMQTGKLVRL